MTAKAKSPELPERGADDHGLHWDGTRRVPLGRGWTAVLEATAATVAITYREPGDVPRTTLPREMAGSSEGKLAALHAEAGAVRRAIARERSRIDGLLAADRSWGLAAWRQEYLDHPVAGRLARGLIWEFRRGDETAVSGIPHDGPARYDRWLLTSAGRVAPLPEDGEARLWHPLSAGPDEVRAWRGLLLGWQIPQPVRQAFREVYVPTAADRQARDCSAWVAGHVCRQWEARTLMRKRGWTTVPASARNDGVARRDFAAAGLRAELNFDPASDDVSGSGLYDYVVSGQVRFRSLDSEAEVSLADVPPLVFTEAIRDADLVVRAASIGTDPDWLDRGGSRRFGGVYWHRFGFGELGVRAEIRFEVLQRLLPGLAIADRCRLDGRYLRVHGDAHDYRIHLGSGNVLLSPSDRHLRIPAARHPAAAQVFLPFDDDQVLSAILGKAFLLAVGDGLADLPRDAAMRRDGALGSVVFWVRVGPGAESGPEAPGMAGGNEWNGGWPVVAYVIIPGIDGSDGQHWQSEWERQWGASAIRISPASWTAPDLDDWVGAVQSAYDVAARQDKHVVLVAHSLGCWAASEWMGKSAPLSPAGAFLVAPPDPRGPAFPRAAAATFTEVSAQPLPCPAIVVASSNDPYCSEEAAAGFAAGWKAHWHLAGPGGHLNSASGLGAWPAGRELLESLTP